MGHIIRELSVNAIVVDTELQPRVKMDKEHSKKLHDLYLEGVAITQPDVFQDPDSGELILADGFHRLDAHIALGRESIWCKVHEGTRRDAMIFAAGANVVHTGLMLSRADKRKATLILLQDDEWFRKPAATIAKKAGWATHKTAVAIREEYCKERGITVPATIGCRDRIMPASRRNYDIPYIKSSSSKKLGGRVVHAVRVPGAMNPVLATVDYDKAKACLEQCVATSRAVTHAVTMETVILRGSSESIEEIRKFAKTLSVEDVTPEEFVEAFAAEGQP